MLNKIYKVIFNRNTGKFVVVSELTRSHVKKSCVNGNGSVNIINDNTNTKRKISYLGATIALSMAVLSQSALAADEIKIGGGTTQGSNASVNATRGIAIGGNATVNHPAIQRGDGLALGANTYSASSGGIAIGGGYKAPNGAPNGAAAGRDSTAIGYATNAIAARDSVVIGSKVAVAGQGNIILSRNDTQNSRNGSGVVTESSVDISGNNNIIIGSMNQLTADTKVNSAYRQGREYGIADIQRNTILGANNTILGGSTTGTQTLDNSILGSTNTINKGATKNTIFGSKNTVESSVTGAYVLGSNITVNSSNSVYFGQGSVATLTPYLNTGGAASADSADLVTKGITIGELGQTSTVIGGKTYNFAGKGVAGGGVITVGKLVNQDGKWQTVGRVIQNVAPGLIGESSTDAVNGSQLFALLDTINNEFLKRDDAINTYIDKTNGKMARLYTDPENTKTGFYYENEFNGDGTPKTGATKIADDNIAVTIKGKNSISGTDDAPGQASGDLVYTNVKSAIGGEITDSSNTFITKLAGVANTAYGSAGSGKPGNTASQLNSAATVGDLKNLYLTPHYFSGDTGATSTTEANKFGRKANEETKIVGGKTAVTDLSDNNIGVVSNGSDTLTIKLAKSLTGLNSGLGNDATNATLLNASGDTLSNAATIADLQNTAIRYFSVKSSASQNNKNEGATADNSIAIGPNANAMGNDSVAIGKVVSATAKGMIAIGSDITATVSEQAPNIAGEYAIAIGHQAGTKSDSAVNTLGHTAVAVGSNAYASGIGAIAVGANAGATGKYSAAFGTYSQASGDNSIAIGTNRLRDKIKTESSGNSSIAIGQGAVANVDNSVALGKGATTIAAIAVNTPVSVEGLNFKNFAASNPSAVVSVGASGSERQIQNVAAGQITATSTDAINGSQLYDTNKKLGKLATAVKDNFGGNAALNADTGEITFTNIGDTNKGTIHEAIKAVKEVVEGTAGEVVVTPDSTATDGHTKYTVSLDSTLKDKINNAADKNLSNLENTGKDVITGLVNAQAEGNYTTVTTEGGTEGNAKTFKISVNTAESISNTDSANNNKVASAAAVKSAVVNAKTKVSVNNAGILTINKTESEDLTANNYTLDVNVTKLKETLNDTYAAKSLETNTFKLTGDSSTSTDTLTLNKAGGLSFGVIGKSGGAIETTASGSNVEIDIKDKGITTDKLADGAVNTTQLANNAVNTDKIADGSVTKDKLDNTVKASLDNANNALQALVVGVDASGADEANKIDLSKTDKRFDIVGSDGVTTAVSGRTVTVKLDETTKNTINNAADKNLSNLTEAGNNIIKNQAISAIDVKGADGNNYVTVSNSTADNKKTFKVGVNVSESIADETTATTDGNQDKVASAQAVRNAIVSAKTKVVLASSDSSGILTVDKTESDNLTANSYTLAINTDKLKETLNDTYAAKSLENNTLKLSGDENSNTNTQALNKSGGLSFAIVGANGDITTTASGNQVSLSLNKATTVTQDDSKAVTSGAVYSAIAAAKPTVTKSGDYITVTGTKSGGINGDTFTVGLDKDRLTQDLANNFSKTDLSNLGAAGKDVVTGLVDVVTASDSSQALSVSSSTNDTTRKKTITLKLDDAKLKEVTGTTNLATEYAKADASNLTDQNKNAWQEALGPLTFKGDSGTDQSKKLGESVKIFGGIIDNGQLTNGNIGVVAGDNGLQVKLAKNLTDLTSVTLGSDTSTVKLASDTNGLVLSNGTAGSAVKIQNVSTGTADTDAVNVSQLKAVVENIGATINATTGEITAPSYTTAISGSGSDTAPTSTKNAIDNLITAVNKGVKFKGLDNGDSITKTLGEELVFSSVDESISNVAYKGENVAVTSKDGKINIALKQADTISSEQGADNSSLVTGAAVKNYVESQVSNSAAQYKGDTGDTLSRKPSEVLTVKGGATGTLSENNIAVEATGTDTLTIKLAKQLTGLSSAEFVQPANGDTPAQVTKIDGNGITITPKQSDGTTDDLSKRVSLTKDGLNNGGNKLTGLESELADKPIGSGLTGATTNGNEFLNTLQNLPSNSTKLSSAATVGDLQKLSNSPLFFSADNQTASHLSKKLGERLEIISGKFNLDSTGANVNVIGYSKGENSYNADNIAVINHDGKIQVGIKDRPTFDRVKIGGESAVEISQVPGTTTATDGNPPPAIQLGTAGTPVQLKNIADPTADSDATNKKYVDDSVTRAAAAAKTRVTGSGAAVVTQTTNDPNTFNVHVDQTINYVDNQGNPLTKGPDGKYYHPADLQDKVYVPAKGDEPAKWYNLNDIGADGQPKEGASATTAPSEQTVAATKLVNPSDENVPSKLSNVGSALGLDGTAGNDGKNGETALTASESAAKLASPSAINAEAARKIIAGADGESGLLSQSGAVLNTATTLGDLQALAQAGLDFTGNNSDTTVHRPLGTKLSIIGEGVSATDSGSFTSASGNINVKASDTDNQLVIQLAKRLKNLEDATFTKQDAQGNPVASEPTTVVSNNGITISPSATQPDPATDPAQTVSLTKDGLDNGGNRITNVGTPTKDTDATNKQYVDNAVATAANKARTKVIGSGAAVVTKSSSDPDVYNVHVDETSAFVDNEGNKLVKGEDGKYYQPTDLAGKTYVPATNGEPAKWVDSTGADTTAPTPKTIAGTQLVNPTPADGKDGTNSPVKLGNVAGVFDNNSVPQKAGSPADSTAAKDTDVSKVNKAIDDAYKANPTNAVNVADLKAVKDVANHGFTIKTAANGGTVDNNNFAQGENINPENDTITFVARANVHLKQEAGKITIATNDQAIVNNAQLPIAYTNAEGKKVILGGDGQYYLPEDIEGKTFVSDGNGGGNWYNNNQLTNGVPTANATPQSLTAQNVAGTSLVGSNGTANTPVQFNNVASGIGGKTDDKGSNTFLENLNKVGGTGDDAVNPNIAVTTQDLKNLADTGHKIQTNGGTAVTVKAGETVQVVNGANTKVSTITSKEGVHTYSINVDGLPMAFKDADGKPLVKVGDNFYKASDIDASTGQPKEGAEAKTPTGVTLLDKDGAAKSQVLSGVADGEISDNSTDAVNGKQLKPIVDAIKSIGVPTQTGTLSDGKEYPVDDNGEAALKTYNVADQQEYWTNNLYSAIRNMNEQGIKFFHTNDGTVNPENQSANTIDSSAAAKYSTAIGYQAKVEKEADRSVAIGVGSRVGKGAKDAVAIGSGAVVGNEANNAIAIGNSAQALGVSSISIGTGNVVRGDRSGAIGDPSEINAEASYAIGNDNRIGGTTVENTTDVFALGNRVTVQEGANNAVALGSDTEVTQPDSVAIGARAKAERDKAILQREVPFVFVPGTEAQVRGQGEEVIGEVSVGNGQETRRITNVAAGVRDTDAVNVSQFRHSLEQIGERIAGLSREIDSIAATSAAMASIPQAYLPGKSMVAIGAGSHKSQRAIAIGVSRISDNGKIILKVNASRNTMGNTTVGVGAGYQW